MSLNLCRAAICLLFIFVVDALEASIINPSFEDPVLAPGAKLEYFANDTIGAGWVVESGEPVLITDGYTGGGAIWADPTDGQQFLYLGNVLGSGKIYQDISLSAATNYSLTFDLANFLNNINGGAKVNVDILLGGVSIFGSAATFERPSGAGYAPQELNFATSIGGTYRLTVAQAFGFGSNVDNFQLTESPSAVPEPSSLTLAGLGVFGLVAGAIRRHRQQKTAV